MSQPQGLEHLCLESHGNTVIGSKDLDQPRDCNSSLLPGKIQHSHSCQGSVLVTGLGAVNSVATGLPRNPYACFSNVDSASLPHQASPRQCSPSHRHTCGKFRVVSFPDPPGPRNAERGSGFRGGSGNETRI